jgi:hypothetical protein
MALRVKPIDITCSDWNCSLEKVAGQIVLLYVRGCNNLPANH